MKKYLITKNGPLRNYEKNISQKSLFYFSSEIVNIQSCFRTHTTTKQLSLVLYGCGTWCLTLREEHKLEVLENEVFRI
jgi:hypothetical protein